MKTLWGLVAAVVVLVGAWLVVSQVLNPAKGPPQLVLPKDPGDKPALVRSANQLWSASPHHFEPFAVVRYLALLTDSLDDDHWRAVSAPFMFAFMSHRGIPEVRPLLLQLEAKLLPKVLRTCSAEELATLVRAANERGFDEKRINEELSRVVLEPLPAEGFSGSRQQELVAAALLASDYRRATEYLGRLTWPPDATPERRAPAELAKLVMDLLEAVGERPKYQVVVRAWRVAAEDVMGWRVYRPLLEGLVVRALAENTGPSGRGRFVGFLTESREEEGAAGYWDRVFIRETPLLSKSSGEVLLEVEGLVAAYMLHFGKPDYGFLFWMKAGRIQPVDPGNPLKPVSFFDRALASARTDPQRLEALRPILAGCYKANEFVRARTTAEAVESVVRDEEVRKAVHELAEEARKKAGDDQKRVAKQEAAIDMDRKRGRLLHMQERLAQARKNKDSDDRIHALEAAVKQLAAQVSE